MAETQKKRINELLKQEKTTANRLAELENYLCFCELFTKTKSKILQEKINSRFKNVRFELAEFTIGGEQKECCNAFLRAKEGTGLPFKGAANHALQVNAGLEIIAKLARFWDVELPIFIDNAESITKLSDVPQQLITFTIDKNCKELKFVRGAKNG